MAIGSGWFQRDYDGFGYEFGYELGTPGGRLRGLAANLLVLRERLAQGTPPPVRRVPILVGGGVKVTLRITAEPADIWQGFGQPEEMAHKNQVLDGWCGGIGRDPVGIERSGGVPTGRFGDQSYGDALLEAGVGRLTFGMGGPPSIWPAGGIGWPGGTSPSEGGELSPPPTPSCRGRREAAPGTNPGHGDRAAAERRGPPQQPSRPGVRPGPQPSPVTPGSPVSLDPCGE
ncbi:MAG: hypothetical protein ABIJ48_00075 [Actinomycetota bacterium]